MEEREERINKLAKSLRQSGFSSSDSSALEKAREMVEIEERIKESQQKKGFFGKLKDKFTHKKEEEAPADIANNESTVNELMKEAGIDETQLTKSENEKKEKIGEEIKELKEEIEEEKKKPSQEKIDEIKKKEQKIKEDLEVLDKEEGERINIE